MVATHYRWDFIGLSTDTKPTPETSEKVVDGSTFYCSDNSKLYVWCKNQWYEKEVSGGGGTTYTAGTGIDITDSTISVDTNTIQPKLTSGSNVTISDNTISATDTTYSNFTGTDGNTGGTSGLVPAPATTDAGKFLKADGTWDTAGGSSVTVVQTTGSSTTDVMSQDATTKMVMSGNSVGILANDRSGLYAVALGKNSVAYQIGTIAIGGGSATSSSARTTAINSIAIGTSTYTLSESSVALGRGAKTTRKGEVNIGTAHTSKDDGYDNSLYRVLGGVHDGVDLHDAATVAQGNTLATSAPTTSTVGVLGQLYTDTTNMHTYQCTAISGDTYTWTQRW